MDRRINQFWRSLNILYAGKPVFLYKYSSFPRKCKTCGGVKEKGIYICPECEGKDRFDEFLLDEGPDTLTLVFYTLGGELELFNKKGLVTLGTTDEASYNYIPEEVRLFCESWLSYQLVKLVRQREEEEVVCPVCKGNSRMTFKDENNVLKFVCKRCRGTGAISKKTGPYSLMTVEHRDIVSLSFRRKKNGEVEMGAYGKENKILSLKHIFHSEEAAFSAANNLNMNSISILK